MSDSTEQMRKAYHAISQLKKRVETLESERQEALAVIGMSCRFPGGGTDLSKYWNLLSKGQQGLNDMPKDRWSHEDFYDPNPNTPGKYNAQYGNFIHNVFDFDAEFFGISSEEATVMDPQHRLLLMCAWEALHDTNIPFSSLQGKRVGVFIGMGSDKCDYLIAQAQKVNKINAYCGVGNTLNGAAGRISYLLNSQGPSMTVDTACSASLVATHYAMQSLRLKECDIAISGGVSLILSPLVFLMCAEMGVLSDDGHTRGFDQKANGFGRGEGCGVIVLKRLSDAENANNRIYASLKGSAVNHNGLSNGLTAPSQLAQEAVIRSALANAHLSAEQISYIEAHATASNVGDVLELEAIKSAYGESEHPCYLGSVKSNFGHLEGAAGVAGLIKTILALYHKEIPAHLDFNHLNQNVTLDGSRFRIATQKMDWKSNNRLRAAGVSAFGWSGQNAHIILQEIQKQENKKIARPPFEWKCQTYRFV
jgi:acyl transferase domain-containing protein